MPILISQVSTEIMITDKMAFSLDGLKIFLTVFDNI